MLDKLTQLLAAACFVSSRPAFAVYDDVAADLVARVDAGFEKLASVQEARRGHKPSETQRAVAALLSARGAGEGHPRLLIPTLTSVAEAVEAACTDPSSGFRDPHGHVDDALRAYCSLYVAPPELLLSIPVLPPTRSRFQGPDALDALDDLGRVLEEPPTSEELLRATQMPEALRFAEGAEALRKRLGAMGDGNAEAARRHLVRRWSSAQQVLGSEEDEYEQALSAWMVLTTQKALRDAIGVFYAPRASRDATQKALARVRQALDVSVAASVVDSLLDLRRRFTSPACGRCW